MVDSADLGVWLGPVNVGSSACADNEYYHVFEKYIKLPWGKMGHLNPIFLDAIELSQKLYLTIKLIERSNSRLGIILLRKGSYDHEPSDYHSLMT